jgi:acyl carrier protein
VNVHEEQQALEAVRRLLSSVVGADRVRTVADDDPLFEQRVVDSLHLVEFVEQIEKTFGLALDGADLTPANFSSLQAIAGYVTARTAER